MKTLAPELSALTIILRSTGPVISTRRSWRSAGIARDPPIALADRPGLGEKIRQSHRRRTASGARRAAPASRSRRRSKRRCRSARKASAARRQDFVKARSLCAADDDAGGRIDQGGNIHRGPLNWCERGVWQSYRPFRRVREGRLDHDIRKLAAIFPAGGAPGRPHGRGRRARSPLRARPCAGGARTRQVRRRIFVERPGGEVDKVLTRQANVAQLIFGQAGKLGERAPRRHHARRPQQGAYRSRHRARAPTDASSGDCWGRRRQNQSSNSPSGKPFPFALQGARQRVRGVDAAIMPNRY